MFNLIDHLKKGHHSIFPFSIEYNSNLKTNYSKYFVSPIGNKNQILFQQHSFSFKTIYKSIERLFYSREVAQSVNRLTHYKNPDIGFILHYLRKLSPSLLVSLKKANIPIVVRISDFAMLCPQAHCLHNGKPCQLCLRGNLWHSVRRRCVQNSITASVLNAVATIYHKKKKFFDLIDCFIVTNPFMYQLMVEAGYHENRLKLIPTFVDTSFFKPSNNFPSNFNIFIFSGRLEYIKGVHVILEALGKIKQKRPNLRWQFIIAGSGNREYFNYLKKICSEYRINDSVNFMGHLSKKDLAFTLSSAHIGIVPSLWYENLPNALLECFSSGLPVIASDIGSLSYCVENNKNGILFPTGNSDKLSEVMLFCLDNPQKVSAMSHQSRMTAKETYSKDEHISTLLTLFSELIDRKKSK